MLPGSISPYPPQVNTNGPQSDFVPTAVDCLLLYAEKYHGAAQAVSASINAPLNQSYYLTVARHFKAWAAALKRDKTKLQLLLDGQAGPVAGRSHRIQCDGFTLILPEGNP